MPQPTHPSKTGFGAMPQPEFGGCGCSYE